MQEQEEGGQFDRRDRAVRLHLIRGGVVVSLVFAGIAAGALVASVERRPAVVQSEDIMLMVNDAVTGVSNLEVSVGSPVDLSAPDKNVELQIEARVLDESSPARLIVSRHLADQLQDCNGLDSRDVVSFSNLGASAQESIRQIRATLPVRGKLTPAPSPAANAPEDPEPIDDDASFVVYGLSFSPTEPYTFSYDLRNEHYDNVISTVTCSLPSSVVMRSDGNPWATSWSVTSFNIATSMAGGGDGALVRAAYRLETARAADWNLRKYTFSSIEKVRDDEGRVQWRASGDYWWRNTETALAVVQPAGFAILEPRSAAITRGGLRLLAGLAGSISIGAAVISARRYVTYAKKVSHYDRSGS